MLEPYVEKSTRTVLRRERGSNPSDLAGITTPGFPRFVPSHGESERMRRYSWYVSPMI